jgi:hypothetical protein
MSFAACSKKTQTTAAPASDNSAASQPNQSASGSPPASSEPATIQTTPAPQGPQTAPAKAQQTPQAQSAAAPPMQESTPTPTQQTAQSPEPTLPPPPLVIPAGTHIVIRMAGGLNSKTANPGDTFTGSLARPVTVRGVEAIPARAGVTGRVVSAKSPGKFKGEGLLSITLTAINIDGTTVPVKTSTYAQVVKGKGKRTAAMAGGGTGAGLLIGGLAGGGKGALIGGLVGAGAGTAGAGLTGNKEVEIPAESAVTFKLAHSIKVNAPASQ